jgi:hypothetical protein
MFDAGDGRMLRIAPDAIPAWRDEAFARIEAFLLATRPPPGWAVFGAVFLFAILVTALQRYLALRGEVLALLVAAATLLWHVAHILKLRRFRRDLRDLRARIAASLALSTPVPAEWGARYRRRNPWRVALHLWVWSLIAVGLAAQHFVPPDAIDRGALLAALAAVGIAWLLHFAARRVDRTQARDSALASRASGPISRP